jgi:rhodanese-related sulfurtransferase
VIVRNPDQDPADILWPAFTIGYERIVGELDGGMPAWAAAGGDVVITRLVGPHEVDGAVLDVRQRVEYAAGHLPTAVHLELGELLRASGGAPDGPTVVMCGHGERAMTAASVLHRAGRRDVSVLLGGADDWAAATGRRLRDAPRPWMNRDW